MEEVQLLVAPEVLAVDLVVKQVQPNMRVERIHPGKGSMAVQNLQQRDTITSHQQVVAVLEREGIILQEIFTERTVAPVSRHQ